MNDTKDLPTYRLVADLALKIYPVLSDQWNHEYGVILKGIEDVWKLTGDDKYFRYIENSISPNINEDGTINGYIKDTYEVDNINSGRLLFELYKQSKDEKYKKAAYLLRSQFDTHPKSSVGVFLHSKAQEEINFIDSCYMGFVYLIQFGREFGDNKIQDDIVEQLITMAKLNQDPVSGLLVQGCNHTRKENWANPITGLSSSFWGRGLGWYAVSLIETLEMLPKNHPGKERLTQIFTQLMAGVVNVQDKKTGVWYQVVDKGHLEGNYLEASASCMFTYSLAKGTRLGYLDSSYKDYTVKAYNGLETQFIKIDDHDEVSMVGTCKSAGLGGQIHKDGTFKYYTSEPVADNDYKGIGTFLMASIEIERLYSQQNQ
ncbi:MAG TPA: glycosyl hydrolase family 88 [Epulopiscium sp.]|nr:glycosyl hydrolase family 88 [Candidatus Epulonipiscium sp.]